MLQDEELLELWNSLPVGVIEFDRDGTIRAINALVSQFLMPLAGDTAFDNAFTLLHPLIPDLEMSLEALERDKLSPRGTAETRLPNGSQQILVAHVSRVSDRFVAVISQTIEA